MKQATIMLVVFGVLVVGNSSAWAENENPFGFETDKHPLEYEYCKRAESTAVKSQYWYICSSAPRIHPDIEGFFLYFVEDVGLCFIEAFSFGNPEKIRDSVDRFKDQIAKKYGPPTRKSEEESKYRYDWDQETGFKGLGDVDTIWVEKAIRGGSYRVSVDFGLVTRDACRKKKDENRHRAF